MIMQDQQLQNISSTNISINLKTVETQATSYHITKTNITENVGSLTEL